MSRTRLLCRGLTVGCAAALAFAACGQQEEGPTDDSYAAEEEFLKVCAAKADGGGSIVVSGIDISSNNGANFNLRAQKANGISFVYLKASEGNTVQDADYVSFRKQAVTLGLLYGAYHFFRPEDDGATQATNFLKAIDKGLGDGGAPGCVLPPVLDWEVVDGISWAKAEANAQAWLDAVQKATGQTPLIYSSALFFPQPVKGSGGLPASFGSYPFWVAQYGPTCPTVNPPWTTWTIFQFSTANNTLDHDYYNGTLSQIQGMAVCASDGGTPDAGADGGVRDGGTPDAGGTVDGGKGGNPDGGGETGDGGSNTDGGTIACGSTSDCPTCWVCITPPQICGDLSGPNFCSSDPDDTLGLPCESNADCSPCGGGLVCAPCSQLSSSCNGSCCQYGSGN